MIGWGAALRLAGFIAPVLSLIAFVALWKDHTRLRSLADAAQACAAAARFDALPLEACLPEVRRQIEAARQSRICDDALLPELRAETRFIAAQACGAGVKRAIQQADSAARERDQARDELARADDRALAAVARAEARAAHTQDRSEHARQVLSSAPRDAAGRIACDADCLRRLGQ